MANMSKKEAIDIFTHWIDYEESHKDKINNATELIEMHKSLLRIVEKLDFIEKTLTESDSKIKRNIDILENREGKSFVLVDTAIYNLINEYKTLKSRLNEIK